MKRPGVPEDFRARYESASAASAGNSVFAITTKKKESRP